LRVRHLKHRVFWTSPGGRSRNTAFALVLAAVAAFGQGGAPGSAPAEDNDKILHFLNSAISWHRQPALEQKLATEPADLTYLEENQRLADQTIVEAFNYARSVADLEAREHAGNQAAQAQGGDAGQYQRLTESAEKLGKQIQDAQSEIEANRRKLAGAGPSRRRSIQAQIDELGSEVGLLNARKTAVETMAQFVASSGNGKRIGLRAQIEELARSVPVALGGNSANNQQPSTSAPSRPGAATLAARAEPTGIWGQATELLHLSGKVRAIDDQLSSTEDLRKSAASLRSPLVNELQYLVHQGDQLFAAADTSDAQALARQTQQIDALTSRFKQVTTALLPLSKVNVLLGIYESTLGNWRESVREERSDLLRQLLLRLGILAVLVGLVFAIGEIWRRASFTYVRDTRRRYQLLLLRRMAMWAAVAIIVVLTFASQLGSAVTFAGLITAGIAVALQNVITSIVGYFFLIGKYGLRVGDRVQIAGVSGEVVDIGLVRMHLMELGGPADPQPSGRIVAISNSVVFQAGPGIFKQIPGTNFIWHELKLGLASETDYHQARQRITEAIERGLGNYRDIIAAQSRLMERNLTTVTAGELRPKVRLHYTASGVEAVVRYPVEMGQAAEMDDHIMRELISALDREPRMKLISAELAAAKAGD